MGRVGGGGIPESVMQQATGHSTGKLWELEINGGQEKTRGWWGGLVESDNRSSTGLIKAGVSKTERERELRERGGERGERERERERETGITMCQLLRRRLQDSRRVGEDSRVQTNWTDVSVTAYILSDSDGSGWCIMHTAVAGAFSDPQAPPALRSFWESMCSGLYQSCYNEPIWGQWIIGFDKVCEVHHNKSL